jgi:hypothetical protein
MTAQYFSPDISEFLFLLSKHKVKYLIVGGEAVIFYGHARLTGDIDIFFEISKDNVKNLYSALNEFWNDAIPENININELVKHGMVFQFGVPPNRIDLMNTIEKISFDKSWKNRESVYLKYSGKKFQIHYIGLNDLIRNKEAVKRYRDQDDIKFLKAAKNKISSRKK